jgi:hypothetical protein
MFQKILIVCFIMSLVPGCDIFSDENTKDVVDFGLYDDPLFMYKDDFDKYLGIDRSKKQESNKIFGVWSAGLVDKDRFGFTRYAYFKIEPSKFTSIIACVRDEPFLAGYTKTDSRLDFSEGRLFIGEGDVEKGLFFSSEGTEYACQIGPIVQQNYEFVLSGDKLVLRDLKTDFEMSLNRYY